ncbi:helix-turn-helix domain-containing protein [Clostridium tetani]|uniref:helix-turn-helix domain-containing protein n=1 Tax=Clostridium tetani TaxID=1513 RepID=UPI0018F8A818|nr:helix-turn-helix transcriptional regulator [Clostridium tetani]
MEIKDIIRKRREELNLTYEQLGNMVGVGKSTVRKWETGMIENMRRDNIIALSKALNISPSVIMGWEDETENTISERIKKGLEIRNMKQAELVEKTGIGKSSISTYILGAYEPKQKNIYKIAKALDVNEAWLMGLDVPMERQQLTLNNNLSKKETTLLTNFNKLNETGKDEAIKRVEELTQIDKYTHEEKEHLMPIAAHDKEGKFSKEDMEHDLNLMKDDKLWK